MAAVRSLLASLISDCNLSTVAVPAPATDLGNSDSSLLAFFLTLAIAPAKDFEPLLLKVLFILAT